MSLTRKVILFTLLFMLTACSFGTPKFNLDLGLPGCVAITAKKAVAGPVTIDDLNYHRVNGDCKDAVPHPPTT